MKSLQTEIIVQLWNHRSSMKLQFNIKSLIIHEITDFKLKSLFRLKFIYFRYEIIDFKLKFTMQILGNEN